MYQSLTVKKNKRFLMPQKLIRSKEKSALFTLFTSDVASNFQHSTRNLRVKHAHVYLFAKQNEISITFIGYIKDFSK